MFSPRKPDRGRVSRDEWAAQIAAPHSLDTMRLNEGAATSEAGQFWLTCAGGWSWSSADGRG